MPYFLKGGLALAAAFMIIVSLIGCRAEKNKSIFGPMGQGDPNEANARMNYELLRLADPATGIVPPNMRNKELKFARRLPMKPSTSRSGQWQDRGPYNVGGRTRALAFDVTNEDIILAGGVTGGMWRSGDAGASFVKTTTPDQLHSVTAIAQDIRTGKTNTWYSGTGEYYGVISASGGNYASGNGIFKSTDGGNSWNLLPATVSNTPTTTYRSGDFDFVWKLLTDHTDQANDVVYAAVINGIYKSIDGGTSWYSVLGHDTSGNSLSDYTNIMITPSGVFYASISSGSSERGIWRSTDGENWVNITPTGWPVNVFERVAMAYAPSDENQVYFLSVAPGYGPFGHALWHYSYLSGDGSGAGGSWENRTTNLPDFDCSEFYDFTFGTYSSQSGYCMAVAVKPDNPDVVFLGGIDVHRSNDGFKTDTAIAWIGGYQCDYDMPSNYIYPNHHPDLHQFLFSPSNNNTLFTASDGGLHKTLNCMADSQQWISLNNGYRTSQFYTVAVELGEVSSDIVVGGMQDNGTFMTTTNDPQDPWKHVFYGDGAYCAMDSGRSNYYLSWQTGKVFKFDIDDNGDVVGKTRIDPQGGSNYLFINPFILNPADQNEMVLAAGYYLWRNYDLDGVPITGNEYNPITTNWERILESNVRDQPGGFPRISALEMAKVNGDVVLYGTTDGRLFRIDSLRSAPVKTQLSSTDFPSGAYVSSISMGRDGLTNILLSFSNYRVKSIFHSSDGGDNWVDVSGNLEDNTDGSGDGPSITWVEHFTWDDTVIYFAGTSIGLFSTTELNGSSTIWEMEGPNTIGNVVINMIEARDYDGLVAVATHGNGIYSRRYGGPTGFNGQQKPSISLDQNAPNPMSNQTSINFSVRQSGQVSLAVYSLDGSIIKTLKNGYLQAGKYQVNWTGEDNLGKQVAPGTYFYELKMGVNRITKKLLKM